MAADVESRATSITLLGRLQDPADPRAWAEFVDRYGPKIYGWSRNGKLQEADAQDVTQQVLCKLVEELRRFRYDPARSFRGWLCTVTRHVLYDLAEKAKRAGQGTGDSAMLELLEQVAAREDLVKHLEEEFDGELLELAMQRVRLRVKPLTWQAFSLVALHGLSPEEAARQLGMRVGTVIVYRGRFQRMVQEEIAELDRQAQQ